ncbi:2-hydroxychromene-2-carboxylate isomerase [Hirschia baltica]|uniref:2-hydroxychromene-2-carboxylate isomerase n=1 Tax=Hirschia baltica (strain ATCC 49814 / DSM 5838 / IFAM 1418) TaxID=582402 RepID=C6XI16_HIRBI|nr:2-hydroxychromene-2-carboxylate isomerase [Hirschia baltica]ACT58842.1 DSBA oxidoreductase [Hirschia baltica ATCC 49814]
MTVNVDFIFDIGSPNVYLAHQVIPNIEERTGVKFNYIPVLLGGIFKSTNNQPPMMAMANVKGKFDYEMLEFRRFLKKHKISNFKMNSAFPINCVLMQRCAVAAKARGELSPYFDAACKASWVDDKDLGKAEILLDVINDAGLNGSAIIEAAATDEVKATLLNNTNAAIERGCFGAPTFYVGDEMFFGKNTLRDVEEEIFAQLK